MSTTVELGGLKASFCKMIRGRESGAAYTFSVTAFSETYFGEYQFKYTPDEKHYLVAIESFGYSDNDNVGNPSVGARHIFRVEDIKKIEDVIVELFTSKQPKPFPLTDSSNFIGAVDFHRGWIRTNTA